jgi:hypothetical protein
MLARYLVGLFAAAAVVPLVARPPVADGDDKARPQPVSAAAVAAAMAGLDACFTENWDDGPIFIEAGPLIPPGLNRVGQYKAEVVTADDLKKWFEGKRRAPSLARVRVLEATERGQTTYTVEISYAGLPVKGSQEIPIGGGRWYKYTVEAGKVTLVERGAVKY